MNKFFLSLLISIIAFSLIMTDAEARRFGGGKSFGMQRTASSFSSANSASRFQPAQAATKPASGASRWLGPLAGLAIGGLIGSLFMGHGLGTGILSWLLIGGAIFLVWTLIRSRLQPATQTMSNMGFQQTNPQQNYNTAPLNSTPYQTAAIPGFDEAEFLRLTKSLFIRLQTAYDNKNLSDIREFTTPEVFAEIQLQIQERGAASNVTEVVSINSELLDAASEHRATIATARFTGLIREEAGAEPTSIKEIWHFRKDDFKPNWAVAGIQQE
jgi:predicted lipid-binding transport protein (Tim44 family)